ncbi:MAG: hypothetical protein KGH98_01030 [Candidatus Micrarchaeota archaeon]|nr:hypothetical protein [Candidatus Micrarchaeota archaeon]
MGLEEIIESIRTGTKAKVDKIRSDADAEAERIRSHAAQKSAAITDAESSKASSDAAMLLAREASKAHIEGQRMYQAKINSEITSALSQISHHASEFVKSPTYSELLNKLAEHAVSELGEDCRIYVQKPDAEKLKKGKKGHSVEVAKEKFIGGLKASSKDNTMHVDYTLESIIGEVSSNISTKLFKKIKV